MRIDVVASSDGHGLYTATSSAGTVLAERSRVPLLDSARAFMAMSTSYSTHPLIMRHAGSAADALIATTIGHAARLTVHESPWGPKFVPWGPHQQARTAILPSTS
jgi:hypothetical protein